MNRAALIAVAAVLLLSGCVGAAPDPMGLTEAERLDFARQEQDMQWYLADLPGERPVVSPTFVSGSSTRPRCTTASST